ncbi:MAG: hypothetical protein AAFZ15_15665 [Bacteroidota bacterium]
MKEYTEIEIVNSSIAIDSIIEMKKTLSFQFEGDIMRYKLPGGVPKSKTNTKTIKFSTQGYHGGIPLNEVKPGIKMELFEDWKRDKKVADGIMKKRYFEKVTKQDWEITEEINPADCNIHNVEIPLSNEEKDCLELGNIPINMDDKWFIYVEDNIIHFFRSWTGIEVFQAEIIYVEKDKWIINELRFTKNPEFKWPNIKSLFENLIKYKILRVKKLIG